MKAYVYYDDLGKDIRQEEIPEDLKEKAEQYHADLIEHLAEVDDDLAEVFRRRRDHYRRDEEGNQKEYYR